MLGPSIDLVLAANHGRKAGLILGRHEGPRLADESVAIGPPQIDPLLQLWIQKKCVVRAPLPGSVSAREIEVAVAVNVAEGAESDPTTITMAIL